MTKIVQLKAENIKRLRAVEIRPEGNAVVIGGKNAAGKSSVLDSILYALAGKRAIPDEPLRRGESKGEVELELDNDLIVRRSFTEKDSYLVVTTKKGAELRGPQQILDNLVSAVGFDPLEFLGLIRSEQVDRLRQLVGIDFSELDDQRGKFYDERREAKKEAAKLEAQLEEGEEPEDVPEDPVDVGDLMVNLQAAQAHNEEHREYKELCDEIEKLRAQLEEKIEEKEKLEDAGFAVPEDEETIREQITSAQEVNRKIEAAVKWRETQAKIKQHRAQAEAADLALAEIDDLKAEQLEEAEFPVEGLSFDDECVLYNGIPLEQASQAEQIRITTAIGLAMNPELRVLMVREGSLLDDDHLALVAELAAEHDAQVWIERVGEGAEVSVVIEDGSVKEAR